MEEKVIILSADFWSLVDETTGQIKSGTSCWYYAGENLNPVVNTDNSLGKKPLKASMPAEFIEEVKKVGVPCVAIAKYRLQNSQGKQILVVDSFELTKSK